MKTPADEPKDDKAPDEKPDAKTPPKLDAIFPDEMPPAAAELIGDIDSYQKRLETEWESAKTLYRSKINRIMEDFVQENLANVASAPEAPSTPKEEPRPDPRQQTEPLAALLASVERELAKSGYAGSITRYRPSPLAIPSAVARFVSTHRRRLAWVLVLVAFAAASMTAYRLTIPIGPNSPLPYPHTVGPVLHGGRLYVADWFRRTLYAHDRRKRAPIVAIENFPNQMVAGFAFTGDALWSVNGLDGTLLQHTLTPDHRVTATFPAPGVKPAGLFFDGTDFWTVDEAEKKLYRLHGRDVQEVRDVFDMPAMTVAGLFVADNRVWFADGASREAVVFRIQNPLREVARFDLDGVLDGASPTGLWLEGKVLWVATREPAGLHRVSLKKLKRSDPALF